MKHLSNETQSALNELERYAGAAVLFSPAECVPLEAERVEEIMIEKAVSNFELDEDPQGPPEALKPVLEHLRGQGYAVAVFTPVELSEHVADTVSERVRALTAEWLRDIKQELENDELRDRPMRATLRQRHQLACVAPELDGIKEAYYQGYERSELLHRLASLDRPEIASEVAVLRGQLLRGEDLKARLIELTKLQHQQQDFTVVLRENELMGLMLVVPLEEPKASRLEALAMRRESSYATAVSLGEEGELRIPLQAMINEEGLRWMFESIELQERLCGIMQTATLADLDLDREWSRLERHCQVGWPITPTGPEQERIWEALGGREFRRFTGATCQYDAGNDQRLVLKLDPEGEVKHCIIEAEGCCDPGYRVHFWGGDEQFPVLIAAERQVAVADLQGCFEQHTGLATPDSHLRREATQVQLHF